MSGFLDVKVARQIEGYLKRQFKNCKFRVDVDSAGIMITLVEGNFTVVSRGSGGTLFVFTVDGRRALSAPVDELDSLDSSQRLSEEARKVFADIIDYIKHTYPNYTDWEYMFRVSGDYKDTNIIKAGTISKPTEIEHKTFRGRKRRSVAEAIIGGRR